MQIQSSDPVSLSMTRCRFKIKAMPLQVANTSLQKRYLFGMDIPHNVVFRPVMKHLVSLKHKVNFFNPEQIMESFFLEHRCQASRRRSFRVSGT